MMWRTAHGGVLVLVLPDRNLAAECRLHRPVPADMRWRAPNPTIPLAPTSRLALEPAPPVAPEPVSTSRRVPAQTQSRKPELAVLVERARPLMPLGRGELAKELGVTPHWARRVIDTLKGEQPGLRLVAGEDET